MARSHARSLKFIIAYHRASNQQQLATLPPALRDLARALTGSGLGVSVIVGCCRMGWPPASQDRTSRVQVLVAADGHLLPAGPRLR
ncbi:MAG: hypothetical protein ACYCTZ_11630 [Candidatus Dormibacteria bacterium]